MTLSMQGNLGCLLGFQPLGQNLGQNPEGQQWVDDYRNSRILTYIFPAYRSIVLVEKKDYNVQVRIVMIKPYSF